jgi:hypothetical protein
MRSRNSAELVARLEPANADAFCMSSTGKNPCANAARKGGGRQKG